jgi:hypothetical protein
VNSLETMQPELSPEDSTEILGHSVEGRALTAHFCGNRAADLRVFVLAGQHGDESDAREAAAAFLGYVRSGTMCLSAQIAVLLDANPDGAAAQTRRNAWHLDLNRDHMLLVAPETAAIHAFVERWHPDLVLDVHTYRPRRHELLQHDFVFPQDVMIDFPTNPAVRTALLPVAEADLMASVQKHCACFSIRCDRYTLVRPSGMIRHSNFDICDARNNLALRFDTPTVLLEGRRASHDDPPVFIPPRIALLRCIEAVIQWAAKHSGLIRLRPFCGYGADPVPVRCQYARSTTPKYMEMQSATRGTIALVGMPGIYFPLVTTTKSVLLPRAYAVPQDLVNVLHILVKQRFQSARAEEFENARTQVYEIESPLFAPDQESSALPLHRVENVPLKLDDFVLFPTDQRGARLLSLFLEPDSQFGFHKVHELEDASQPGSRYPIARLV